MARQVSHNTPEQVTEYLTDALELVDMLEPPDDLRQIVFAKACDFLSAKTINFDPGDLQPVAIPGMTIPRNHRP